MKKKIILLLFVRQLVPVNQGLMKPFEKIMKLAIVVFLCINALACEKDTKELLWPDIFNCKVDDALYKDHQPYLVLPVSMRTPKIEYSFDADRKRLSFHSRLMLVNKGDSERY